MRVRNSIICISIARSLFVLAAIVVIAGIARADLNRISLTGIVKDPSGLGIPGVSIAIVDAITGTSQSAVSDSSGRFGLRDLHAGKYKITAAYRGFAPYSRELVLDDSAPQPFDIKLQILPMKESVSVVTKQAVLSDSAFRENVTASPQGFAGDTAQLLEGHPGVSLYGNGGVSSLPAIHGMADDRVQIKVDGMELISACANHMNPPLSYIDPSHVGIIKVFAGITPVSMGGDSIGGTISVDSPQSEFAAGGRHVAIKGQARTYYRSNGDGYGANLQLMLSGKSLSMDYNGSLSHADNYTSGGNFKPEGLAAIDRGWLSGNEVGSSRYESQNHSLRFALRSKNHLVELTLGLQHIPYQGFPNQRMDMTRNDGANANLHYTGQYRWGVLEARIYSDYTRHSMDFSVDKQFSYGSAATILAPGMPMETKGVNFGALVSAEIPISNRNILGVGIETQRYRLNDWWPPSPSVLPPGYSVGGMAPDTFVNIHNGRRDRAAVYVEWETNWNSRWISLLGVRSDTVMMNTGDVHGYNNTMMYNGAPLFPATTFNSRDRKRIDNNLDITALSRYTPAATLEFEAGYAMKTRSPNLYERYAWSTNSMAMEMVNFAGDGNYYVGNLELKPEVAHTFSATASWHAASREQRWISVTPHYTLVHDYIDARRCPLDVCGTSAAVRTSETATSGFVYLQFLNQSARIYGVDISGHTLLAQLNKYGSFSTAGTLSVVRGKNRTTGDNLFNIMPVYAKVAVAYSLGDWTSTIEEQLVGSKSNLSRVRNEVRTGGYGLLNLRSSYSRKKTRIDVGLENLLNKFYASPLGGAYLGQGPTMSGSKIPWGVPIAGMGRSIYVSLTWMFRSE
jgi:iron complex outermembrane recepter protein